VSETFFACFVLAFSKKYKEMPTSCETMLANFFKNSKRQQIAGTTKKQETVTTDNNANMIESSENPC